MPSFEKLVTEIKEYDSNTFFAKGCNLTDIEANYLAEKCIEWFIEHELDGHKLDVWLAEERGIA